MSEIKAITVKIKVAWWFTYLYFPLFKLTAMLSVLINEEFVPNKERLKYWIGKAVTVERPKVKKKSTST